MLQRPSGKKTEPNFLAKKLTSKLRKGDRLRRKRTNLLSNNNTSNRYNSNPSLPEITMAIVTGIRTM
jgi:hypothetical protein